MAESESTGSKTASTQRAAVLGAACFFGLLAFACGGIDEPDLFTGGDAGSTTAGDSGSKGDARATGKDGGVTTSDAGVITGGNVVACTGGVSCQVSVQVCCQSSSGNGVCDHAANCSRDNQLPIPCDDANDCAQLGHPGQLCCVQGDNGGNVTSVTCRAPGDCRADQGQTNLCDITDPSSCPNGGTCTPSVSLPDYNICAM